MFDTLKTIDVACFDSNKSKSAHNVLKATYGNEMMGNLEPVPFGAMPESERGLKNIFAARRPARPIYRDHAMVIGR